MGKDFYDAACERLAALKSYKLVYKRNKSFRLTRIGFEFLKHEDKEFYLGKIILSDKYKRTKHPDVFLECLKVYVSLSKKDRNSIRKIIWRGIGYDYWSDLRDKDWKIWLKFVEKVRKRVPDKSEDTISRVCDSSLRSLTYGVKSPIDLSCIVPKFLTL